MAMQDLRQVHVLTWDVGEAAGTRLEAQLGDLAAKLAVLGFLEDEADEFMTTVQRLQANMVLDFEPDESGSWRGDDGNYRGVPWPKDAPKTLVPEVRDRALAIDKELLALRTFVGSLRVRVARRKRRRLPKNAT